MNVDVIRDPVYILRINKPFDQETHDHIFQEMVANEERFEDATIDSGNDQRVNKDIRNNTVLYLDHVYKGQRGNSILLSSLDSIFQTAQFKSLLTSSPYPLSSFNKTNYHETQVSRYGNSGQSYTWHVDALSNPDERMITVVYYAGLKKYEGGELLFSNSPIIDGKLVEKKPEILAINPEPNTMYVFASDTTHAVAQTQSLEEFKLGRFSVNCWVGIK